MIVNASTSEDTTSCSTIPLDGMTTNTLVVDYANNTLDNPCTPFSVVLETLDPECVSTQQARRSVVVPCVICKEELRLPPYAVLTQNCYLKCQTCPLKRVTKNWTDIILTALHNLERLHHRKYFHCSSEICAFIDQYWSEICPHRPRTTTWGNTVMSQISTQKDLFQSHKIGSGYWALRRTARTATKPTNADYESATTNTKTISKAKSTSSIPNDQISKGATDAYVEAIISKRILGSEVQYLIKWEKLARQECCWVSNFDLNCPLLIQAFELAVENEELWTMEIPKRKKIPGVEQTDFEKRGGPLATKTANKRQRSRIKMIPVTQTCHQCRTIKPFVIVCSTEECNARYCSNCLTSEYGEDMIELENELTHSNNPWKCPRCKKHCTCDNCKKDCSEAGFFAPEKIGKRKVIGRVQVEDGSWMYLVSSPSKPFSESTWVSGVPDMPTEMAAFEQSLKVEFNTAKLPQKKRRTRSGSRKKKKKKQKSLKKRGRRTSDFDISRVVFGGPSQKLVLPKKTEVIVPKWRLVNVDDPPKPKKAPKKKKQVAVKNIRKLSGSNDFSRNLANKPFPLPNGLSSAPPQLSSDSVSQQQQLQPQPQLQQQTQPQGQPQPQLQSQPQPQPQPQPQLQSPPQPQPQPQLQKTTTDTTDATTTTTTTTTGDTTTVDTTSTALTPPETTTTTTSSGLSRKISGPELSEKLYQDYWDSS